MQFITLFFTMEFRPHNKFSFQSLLQHKTMLLWIRIKLPAVMPCHAHYHFYRLPAKFCFIAEIYFKSRPNIFCIKQLYEIGSSYLNAFKTTYYSTQIICDQYMNICSSICLVDNCYFALFSEHFYDLLCPISWTCEPRAQQLSE